LIQNDEITDIFVEQTEGDVIGFVVVIFDREIQIVGPERLQVRISAGSGKIAGRNVTRVVTGESCSSVGRVIVSEAANRATKASVTSHLNDIVGRISV